ncbi:Zn-dependent exopeptidase [Ascodesmis nigricans]|uniref:Peptide hydrolase n=1 Tax=Ascodesmis nigricans TaxID=341454 RepID=A0A4S2MYV5_9PEZI|nr:Zn-dependent exopeptidase [Ascodesmis nigricans]
MKISSSLLLAALTLVSAGDIHATGGPDKGPGKPDNRELVESNKLRRGLSRTGLLLHGVALQAFADANGKTRAFGTKGHNATVSYIKGLLDRTGYYDTYLQSFPYTFSEGSGTFSADGTDYAAGYFTYGPAGEATGTIVPVNNFGCEQSDFPAEVAGNIALVSRGTCEFGLKVALAGNAGASAIAIYNNAAGNLAGTLGAPSRPDGPYVPAVSLSGEDGTVLLAAAQAGNLQGTVHVDALTEARYSSNIIATTKEGDKNNIVMAGAHSDSVSAGPGINDNGSGSIGVLEVALALTKYKVKQAVRFAWWTAEEFGLVGAEHYVANLSAEEQSKIALYLNFDMIASPNFGYFIYDGDGSTFNLTGPAGSDHIEKTFEDYFRKEARLPSAPSQFDGRSDYGPFLEAGIPSGGLFTGAEGLKTKEEAKLFGGEAGVSYDVNYHEAGDTLANCNVGAWIQNTKAIAHTVAVYARSLAGIPRGAGVLRRRVAIPKSISTNRKFACGGTHNHNVDRI